MCSVPRYSVGVASKLARSRAAEDAEADEEAAAEEEEAGWREGVGERASKAWSGMWERETGVMVHGPVTRFPPRLTLCVIPLGSVMYGP
eukprot:3031591-Rhodomonas_salina.2